MAHQSRSVIAVHTLFLAFSPKTSIELQHIMCRSGRMTCALQVTVRCRACCAERVQI